MIELGYSLSLPISKSRARAPLITATASTKPHSRLNRSFTACLVY
jgi:hypothetical protein